MWLCKIKVRVKIKFNHDGFDDILKVELLYTQFALNLITNHKIFTKASVSLKIDALKAIMVVLRLIDRFSPMCSKWCVPLNTCYLVTTVVRSYWHIGWLSLYIPKLYSYWDSSLSLREFRFCCLGEYCTTLSNHLWTTWKLEGHREFQQFFSGMWYIKNKARSTFELAQSASHNTAL